MTKVTSQEILVITGKDFARGMATNKFSNDGFLSTEIHAGVNLTHNPGAIYGQPAATDISPSSSGAFVATCKGGGSDADLGFKNNYAITNTGKFYSYDGSTMTNDVTDGSKTYSEATTDIIFYKEYLYCTSTDNITRGTMPASTGGAGYNITSINNIWGSTTLGIGGLSSLDRHCMVIFEDILWIADGNKIHKWDGTTATASALVLASDQNITALSVDPSSGRMMIATTQGANASGVSPRTNKISFWDGTSSKVIRAVTVDAMVTAFQVVGGTMYVAYGRNIGYWNGSGISWLRTLRKITSYSATRLPYKHRMTSIENTLYVVDGNQVLAYESVLSGYPKVFYYVYGGVNGFPNGYTLNTIQDFGEGYLGISHTDGGGTNYFMKFPTRNITTGSSAGSFQAILTTFFTFKKRVRIKMIKMAFADVIDVNKSPWGVSVYGSDNNNPVYFNKPYPGSTSTYELEFLPNSNTMKDLEDFYLYLTNGNDTYTAGIRKITVYYDFVD